MTINTQLLFVCLHTDKLYRDFVRPPSTGRFTPLIYCAAGLAKKAAASATSSGLAKRLAGTILFIVLITSSSLLSSRLERVLIIDANRGVAVNPRRTLFTVIPCGPNSFAMVLLQLATAPRIVLLTPSPSIGCFTEVEIMLIIRP